MKATNGKHKSFNTKLPDVLYENVDDAERKQTVIITYTNAKSVFGRTDLTLIIYVEDD